MSFDLSHSMDVSMKTVSALPPVVAAARKAGGVPSSKVRFFGIMMANWLSLLLISLYLFTIHIHVCSAADGMRSLRVTDSGDDGYISLADWSCRALRSGYRAFQSLSVMSFPGNPFCAMSRILMYEIVWQ